MITRYVRRRLLAHMAFNLLALALMAGLGVVLWIVRPTNPILWVAVFLVFAHTPVLLTEVWQCIHILRLKTGKSR